MGSPLQRGSNTYKNANRMNYKQGINWLMLLMSLFLIQGVTAQDTPPVAASGGRAIHAYTLTEAQAYAVENSYKARVAVLDVEESEFQVKETMAMGFPQLNGFIDYQYNIQLPVQLIPAEFSGGPEGEFTEIVFGTAHNMVANANLSQLIFDGTYIVGVRGAKVYNELVRQQKGATDFDVKKNTADAYYTAVVAIENHKMLQENLDEIEKQLSETQILYANGLVEEQNVDQLRLNAGKVRIEVENAERQILISRNMLKFQLGIPLTDSLRMTEDIQQLIDNAIIDIAGRYTYDVTQNIQYKVSDAWVNIRETEVDLEKAKFLPSLNAQLNQQWNAPDTEFNYFNGDSKWYSATFVGLRMDVPIFSGMGRHNSLQKAKVNSLKMQVQREELKAGLELQLSQANANFNQSLAAFNISLENVEVAKSIRDKTNRKFQEGMATSFEVTQAQSQLINDQFGLVGAALQLFEAKTAIDEILNNY